MPSAEIKSLYLFTSLQVPFTLNQATQHRHPNPFNSPRSYFAFTFPTLVRLALVDARASDISAVVGAPELFPALREFILLDGTESVGAEDAPLRMRRTLHDYNPFFGRLDSLVLGGDGRSRGTSSRLLDTLYPHGMQSATNIRHLTLAGSYLYPHLRSPFFPLPNLETLDIDLDSPDKLNSVINSLNRSDTPGPLPRLKLIRFTLRLMDSARASYWRTAVIPGLVKSCTRRGVELREVDPVKDTVEGALQRYCLRLGQRESTQNFHSNNHDSCFFLYADGLRLDRAPPATPTASS